MISYDQVLKLNSKKIQKKELLFFKKKRIKFLLNFNFFQLEAYTSYYLKKKFIQSDILSSDFDQVFQQLNSIKKKDNVDLLIVGNDFNFVYDLNKLNIKDFGEKVLSQLELLKKIKKKFVKTEIIFFNVPEILKNYFFYNSFYKNYINQLNYNLKIICDKNNIHLLEYNSLITEIGQKNFYSAKNFYSSKSLLSDEGSDILARSIAKIARSIFFTRKKCLVLDLDNTLWGGVLGEDGIKGLKIGNSYIGNKYLNFQKYIKNLSETGIILAICSKNNFGDVKKCFQENTNLFLKLSDFSVIKANWDPKFKNINEIASELNIGKDSIVFFDDSKFERDQMRKFNPEINVISVPEDVDSYISAIDETAFFYSSKEFTNEDLKKKQQYDLINKAKKFKLKFKSQDTDNYLKSLKMKIYIDKVNDKNFSRCVQMLNKTNQFNFTTNRYTESTFKNYLNQNKIISFVLRLEDKFGDHGITGLITAKIVNQKCIIDNFLLSCRILGRKIEEVLLQELIYKLKLINIKKLIGIYKKTQKNIQCQSFYEKYHFKIINNEKYQLNIEKIPVVKNSLMKVVHE